MILTTSFYGMNQKIYTKKSLFPKFQLIPILLFKYAKNSKFENFESALYSTSVSMPLSCLIYFIERETQNVVLKFREIFRWKETVLRAHGTKSVEKSFFCQIYVIEEKWYML